MQVKTFEGEKMAPFVQIWHGLKVANWNEVDDRIFLETLHNQA